MNLPFSKEDFLAVFRRYNEAVWPASWALTALAAFILLVGWRSGVVRSRVASGGLALLWIWMGVAYHWMFFATINPAARLFGALFVAQGALFVWLGIIQAKLRFAWPAGWNGAISVALLMYSLVLYPILNHLLGHRYPEVPTFGLPCPTTIFTLGVLWWLRNPFPLIVFVIPLAWAVIGGSAAFMLGVPQDLGLLIAGAVSILRLRRPPLR